MALFESFLANFLSPGILFFILGITAGALKSNLEVPESISRYLSIYLMMSIGFKGGNALATSHGITDVAILTMLAGIGLGFLMPFIGFLLLRATTKLDPLNAAAVAAHYGSISMVTFAAAVSFLHGKGVEYQGYIAAIVALMEAPAIISGLYLARKFAPASATRDPNRPGILHESLTNGAIMLLMGAFFIGWMSGDAGMAKMKVFLIDPFQGVLALFLLDMGLLVVKHLSGVRSFSISLVLFGIYMPLIGAGLGLAIAAGLGLDVGTGYLFVILAASASYIAVPAALRLALPEANPGIYVPMSLAITFPFNVIVGIPLYYSIVLPILAGGSP
ncbi:MAG: sodium-dependent bicarbonate transport family permease [Holosporales bacterium]